MHCEITGVNSPTQVDIDQCSVRFGWNARVRQLGEMVMIFRYPGIREYEI
jgi:hypothetical protein